ncbi:MAG: ATP synthase F1 subunit delta [Armatimonadota bacterium]
MTAPRIAARYAEALFDLSQQRGEVEPMRRRLAELVELIGASPELRSLLQRPDMPPEAKVEAVGKALGASYPGELVATLALLVRHQRGDAVAGVREAFEELAEEAAGVVVAEVSTVLPLTEEQRRRLVGAAEGLTGKRVRLVERVDPAVLAGVRLRLGDQVIDGSAAGRLAHMREQLMDLRG